MGLSQADLFLLVDIEQRLVATGTASLQAPDITARAAALLSAGYLSSPAPDFYALTPLGWIVVHAFREHLAAHREAFNLKGELPPFVEPPPADERANRCDLAERAFIATLAVSPFDVNVAALADRMLASARTFIERRKVYEVTP